MLPFSLLQGKLFTISRYHGSHEPLLQLEAAVIFLATCLTDFLASQVGRQVEMN